MDKYAPYMFQTCYVVLLQLEPVFQYKSYQQHVHPPTLEIWLKKDCFAILQNYFIDKEVEELNEKSIIAWFRNHTTAV